MYETPLLLSFNNCTGTREALNRVPNHTPKMPQIIEKCFRDINQT